MGRRYRPRKEFKFWLYRDVTLDAQLITAIGNLKTNRSFTKMIRDGLRLLWALSESWEAGQVVLLELYPQYRSQFEPKPQLPAPAPQIDTGVLKMTVADAVKTAMQSYAPQLPAPTAPGGIKQLVGAAKFEVKPPRPDDDDDENTVLINVKKDENAGNQGMKNFYNSMMALQTAMSKDDGKKTTTSGSRNLIENRT